MLGARVCARVWDSPAASPLSRSQSHPGPAGTLLVLVRLMELREGGVRQILHLMMTNVRRKRMRSATKALLYRKF